MAVDPRERGAGLGCKLVRFAEAAAFHRGYETIEMMARVSAVGFYRKLGYEALGDTFIELGIPHLKMAKPLSLSGTPEPRSAR